MIRSSLVVGAALLVVSGCGSSGTKTVTATTTAPRAAGTTQPATVTKVEFIAQADPICRAAGAKMKPLLARANSLHGESEAKEGVPVIRQLVAVQRAFVARLRALPEPPADRSVISKMLAAFDESATDGKNLGEAVQNGDPAAERAAIDAGSKAKALSHGIAKGYGFKVCGASE